MCRRLFLLTAGRCSRKTLNEQRRCKGGTQGVAEAFGKVAANNLLKTMDQQHYIDIPTIAIADPAVRSTE